MKLVSSVVLIILLAISLSSVVGCGGEITTGRSTATETQTEHNPVTEPEDKPQQPTTTVAGSLHEFGYPAGLIDIPYPTGCTFQRVENNPTDTVEQRFHFTTTNSQQEICDFHNREMRELGWQGNAISGLGSWESADLLVFLATGPGTFSIDYGPGWETIKRQESF